MSTEITVQHLPEARRYALVDEGKVIGSAHYRDLDTGEGIERVFFHTVVDDAYAGQGLASRLAVFALEDTVAHGHKIVAVCPYIKAYTAKHHRFDAHLVVPGPAHLRILPRG